MINEAQVREALKGVLDPELGFSIVDLGLVYKVEIKEAGVVLIEMTLTSPGCPLAPVIDQMVRAEVGGVKGVKSIDLRIVWDPPWISDMMSEEVKAELGM